MAEFDEFTTVTLPHKNPPPHVVRLKTLPCYVILVHGVNDVGEAYEAQEKGLCWGLAERLGRNYDLRPYEYKLPKKDRSDPLEAAPDRTYYHRVADSSSHSPVIPFYWGFREENAKIAWNAWQGELLDRDGNRLDRDGAKNGGPFVNAANCLPHMWAPGWKPPVPGINAFASFSDKTHPMLKASHRRYQVLAALRLAMLIRIIRKRHPEVAINVVAHSMGCLVTLLAQVYLMDEGNPPADGIVMNNPPYSFEENLLDSDLFGDLNQTSRARIETLMRIAKAFHAKRAQTPGWAAIHRDPDGGLAWKLWADGKKKDSKSGEAVDYAERDNRGRISLYFTPHDRTVALFNTQGIGWKGVPDQYTSEWTVYPDEARLPAAFRNQGWSQPETRSMTWNGLMDELHATGFRQRVFLRQLRGGKPFQVGLPPQHVSIREEHDNYPGWWARITRLDETLPLHSQRRINAEPLNPPVDYNPGPDVLPVSPIDAAIALANGATEIMEGDFDDPRPAQDRPPICPLLIPPGHWESLREMLNQGKPPEQQIGQVYSATEIRDEQRNPTGRLWVRHDESPDETRSRLQRTGGSENSFHSSIVSNHWHSQAVTAYDLAVSRTIWWSEEEKRFYGYLCEVADWRIKVKEPDNPQSRPQAKDKILRLNATGFYDQEDPKNKELIMETATYYAKGKLPPQVDQAKTPEQLSAWIHFETTGHRSPVA